MNALASRKKLLIAESELNRAHLVQEWLDVTNDVQALAHRVKTIGSLASVAASLISLLGWLRSPKPAPTGEKTSWVQTILKGAQLAGSFWSDYSAARKAGKT